MDSQPNMNYIPFYIANGGTLLIMVTIDVMEAHPKDHKPPSKVIVRPAATDQAWRALWAWLLSPTDNDMAARPNTKQEMARPQDQKGETDGY